MLRGLVTALIYEHSYRQTAIIFDPHEDKPVKSIETMERFKIWLALFSDAESDAAQHAVIR